MTKKNKITLSVLAVILILGIVSVIVTGGNLSSKITSGIGTPSGKDLSSVQTVSFESDYPLVQTAQRDLFYSPYPDGTIKYFKFNGNGFDEVTDGVQTKDVTLECSYQKVKFTLYYLKADVGTVGYGLFCTEQNRDVKLFSYILVRLMDTPAAYKSAAKTEQVLLVDTDAADAYKADKTYSDMYSYDLKTGKTALVMSQRDRTVQEDGTVSEGWTIFTDSSLNSEVKRDLFASTRVHDTKTDDKLYCLMTVENSKAGKKVNAITVNNCPSYEIREKDGDYYCFVATESGFDLVKNGDRKAPLKSFNGKFSGYSVSGDWIFDKTECEFTNMLTGETKSVKKVDMTGLSGFASDESGTKFVLFINGDKQSMTLCDTANGKTEVIKDKLFDNGIRNFCFINETSCLFSDYNENGTAKNIILTF